MTSWCSESKLEVRVPRGMKKENISDVGIPGRIEKIERVMLVERQCVDSPGDTCME